MKKKKLKFLEPQCDECGTNTGINFSVLPLPPFFELPQDLFDMAFEDMPLICHQCSSDAGLLSKLSASGKRVVIVSID